VHSTPSISENALALRLPLAGVKLRRYGENWQILTGNQVVLERGSDSKPIMLEQIEAITRRLDYERDISAGYVILTTM
jgi:hypothetical protein